MIDRDQLVYVAIVVNLVYFYPTREMDGSVLHHTAWSTQKGMSTL